MNNEDTRNYMMNWTQHYDFSHPFTGHVWCSDPKVVEGKTSSFGAKFTYHTFA